MTKADDQLEADDQPSGGASTRQRILDATLELVAEVGWAGVRVRQVAERAGVNNALVHYHFGSKEALLDEAAAAATLALIEEATAGVADAPDVRSAVADMMGWLEVAPLDESMARLTSEVLARATRPGRARDVLGAELARYRTLVAALATADVAAGRLPPGADPDGVAAVVVAALDGLVLHRVVDPTLDLGGAQAAFDALLAPPADPPTERSRSRTPARGARP